MRRKSNNSKTMIKVTVGAIALSTIFTVFVACNKPKDNTPEGSYSASISTEETGGIMQMAEKTVETVETPEWWANRGPAYRVNEKVHSIIYSTNGDKSAYLEPNDVFVTEGTPGYKNTIKVYFQNNSGEINMGYVVFDEETVESYYTYIGG